MRYVKMLWTSSNRKSLKGPKTQQQVQKRNLIRTSHIWLKPVSWASCHGAFPQLSGLSSGVTDRGYQDIPPKLCKEAHHNLLSLEALNSPFCSAGIQTFTLQQVTQYWVLPPLVFSPVTLSTVSSFTGLPTIQTQVGRRKVFPSNISINCAHHLLTVVDFHCNILKSWTLNIISWLELGI